MTVRILLFFTLLAAGSLRAQTEAEPQEQEPAEELAEPGERSEEQDSEGTATTRPPPKPPDGLLPLTELIRLDYTPRDRPKPLLQGHRLLVVSPSGFVDGHDAQTGEFAWKLGLPGEELFDPVVFEAAELGEDSDGSFKILLSEPSGHVLVIDGPTGEIERETRLPLELALPPVRGPGDILFLATPSGDIVAYDIGTQNVVFQTATGEVPLALSSTETLLMVSGGDQSITAIDLPAGTVRWTFRGRAAFYARAAFGGDEKRVYIGDDTGEFYALDARNGKVKFRWSTGASIRSQALVENKRVYVATFANSLYAFHAHNGDEHWRAFLPGRPATPPLRVGKRLVVATFDGVLVEINPERGLVGKQYQAPGELVYAPSFYLARPTAEELAAAEAFEAEAPDDVDAQGEDDDGVLSEEGELPAVEYVAPEDDTLFEDEGADDGEDAAAEAETSLDPETDLVAAEEGEPRDPLWFERSRIALALRSGQVLLLYHRAADAKPAAQDEVLDDLDEEEESERRRRRPTSGIPGSVPF